MAAELSPEVLDEVYGAPLDEFVKLRDARAKALRSAGDRAGAGLVKKLRKPSVAAWAVNQLSRRCSDDLAALLAAGEALRQAQLGGGDREAIRAAAADERSAVERLVGEASDALGGGSAATLEEVRGTLHAAASDGEARDLIRRGLLTEARRAVGLGGFGAGPGAGSPGARAPAPPEPAVPRASAAASAEAAAAAAAAKERKRAAKEGAKAAKAALREADNANRAAGRAVTAAERDRDRARDALDAAERDLGRARREAEAAQAALERARAELDSAEDVA